MSKPRLLRTIPLIACILALVAPTLAQFPGGFGFFGGSLGFPDVQRCLSSMRGVPGCFEAFISSVLSVRPQVLNPACCEAFLEVDENCWPKVFPLSMTFPPKLKDHCIEMQDSPETEPCYNGDEYGFNERGDCDYY